MRNNALRALVGYGIIYVIPDVWRYRVPAISDLSVERAISPICFMSAKHSTSQVPYMRKLTIRPISPLLSNSQSTVVSKRFILYYLATIRDLLYTVNRVRYVTSP